MPDANSNERGNPPKHVVGIGASAGGLESLEQMFRKMPVSSGMAFVVIQHLSPDFKSMMSELLARETSMRIEVAEDGIRVECDVIYLMPPKKEMIIADGCLHLSDKDTTHGLTLPIDHFFNSLARELGESAVAIILSGSGSDGTRGVEEIAKRGGLVISESLTTAKFDGMPSSAQATGMVDLVLAPSDIGSALHDYANDPNSHTRGQESRRIQDPALKGIDAIFQLFRNAYDIDFSSYKDATVMRRIRRRSTMVRTESLDEYARLLQTNPEELHALYGDLLIGVTQFFRDPEIFEFLSSDVLPKLISERRSEDAIRIWVAGCATGEEAYSIAIAFQEAMRRSGTNRPLKIFATDVHQRSIEHASRGIFSEDVLKRVNRELLERYFTERTDGFQLKPEIRQMLVFAPHNVLRDAPFTDLDLVSCRNLLIYLRPGAQRRAISLFHYGLRVGGVLLLGGSESAGELSTEFSPISERHRLYRKRRDVRLAHNLRSPLAAADTLHRNLGSSRIAQPPSPGSSRNREIHDELLDRFLPPSILIDASRSVIDTFAGAEKLLRFPTRQPTLDILDLVDREIRTPLSGAIGRAMRDRATVRFGNVRLSIDEIDHAVHMTVAPLGGETDDARYLIAFDPVAAEPDPARVSLDDANSSTASCGKLDADDDDYSREHIRQLEQDLLFSRENLQATIEELETSNEELQATNEELIASNEELQSTNEELHSLNEELYSVNSEHQRKIEELAELNRDMNHLLEHTDVSTVFLDRDLKIRRFTSKVQEIFELIDEDVGRSIHVFGSKLRIDDLVDRLKGVLATGQAYEREVSGTDGTSYLMRLIPYRPDDGVSGVVMMWVDVSSLEVLRGRLRWLSAIVESTSDAVVGQDMNNVITSWNRGAEKLYGYSADEIIGKSIEVLIPQERRHEVPEYCDRILRGETIHSIDTIRLHRDQSPIHVSLTVSPVFDSDKQVIGTSKIARDIGERIQMEREIRGQIRQRERFLAMLSHELRNPLNAVGTATTILSDTNADAATRTSATATLRRQVGIINHLLADLLDVARIAEDRITLQFEPLDVRTLFPTIREIVKPELDQHGCDLVIEMPDHPIFVNGDRTRLVQTQVNLIHNAAKYSGTTRPIRVTVRARGENIQMTVADEGRGIPPEELESIFAPFSQLNRSRNQSDGGLGVGLTLAKSLVELHGGTIRAESDGEGRGSAFHIWLPKFSPDPGLPNATGMVGDDDTLAESNPAKTDGPRKSLAICVVEDIADSREMLKKLLELKGHQVMAASDGAAAVELLSNESFDFALVDLGLPDMSGLEVARQVRARPLSKHLKLIALTGYGQPDDINDAKAAGFDLHIVKPISPEVLHRLCESHGASN